MPKRRRERDKPKGGPDALYNPNKRVLLSYASDEEEAAIEDMKEPPVNVAEAAVDDRTLANYQMDEYPESESEAALGATVNHGNDAVEAEEESANEDVEDENQNDDGDEEPSTAHGRTNDDWRRPGWKDPTTNQWPKLGPVSYDEHEEAEYDPETEEAMAYLKAVRSERHTIPEILSAPRQLQADADHLQDTNYHNFDETQPEGNDGSDDADVTIQVAPAEPDSTLAEDDATNPQKVFTRVLLERFMEQRKQLHAPPSMEKLAELPESCPISFPRGNNKASTEWYRLLSTTAPLPAQLRSMDQATVFNLLELVQKQYLPKNCNLSRVTSAWIWSLLARLDDVGTMSNDEVFPLRELGKRTVIVLLSFTNPELAAGLESLEQEVTSVAPVESDDSQTAPAIPMTENTLATLDMILVVIGEAFGQKDLLEVRPTWTPTEKSI